MYTVYESFMAKRIIAGKNYGEVIQARPDLKVGIDAYLTEQGHVNLIQG